ncbi:MAG: iron chaperone [Candidatus Izemoplasmataceae bacterium]
MKEFQDFLDKISDEKNKEKLIEVLEHIEQVFPFLEKEIKWNQPMFMDHGTFIIAFSVSKHHFSVAPEYVTLEKFRDDIVKSGYETSKMLFKIKWTDVVDYELLDKIITFNIADKKECTTFWRAS